VVDKRRELQFRHSLYVAEKSLLLSDIAVYALLHLFYAALHFLGLGSDIGAGADTSVILLDRVEAYFGTLILVSPLRCLTCSLPQLFYLLAVLLILSLCEAVTPLLVLPPDREVSVLNIYGLAVQHQYMVGAGVQQVAVMGDENKSALACQVFLYLLTGAFVQVVCGLVNESELLSAGKQQRQKYLCALSVAQCIEWAVEYFRGLAKLCQFAYHAPFFAAWGDLWQELRGSALCLFVADRAGKETESYGSGDSSAVAILPHEQAEKGSLAFAVPADKSQLPVGIYRERDVFKDVVGAAVITECKVVYKYL